jgi:glycosyltransferase involved in cell wall biosynthesis
MGFAAILEYLRERGARVDHLKTDGNGSIGPTLTVARRLLSTARAEPYILWEDYWQRRRLLAVNAIVSHSTRIKLVGVVQAFDNDYRTSRLKNLLDDLASRVFFYLLDMIITSGQSGAERIVNLGAQPAKVRVIYPGLRPEFAYATPGHRAYEGAARPIRLLFVGRLHPVKGIDYLVKAVRSMQRRDVVLTVVAYSTHHPSYANHIKSLVEHCGIGDSIECVGPIHDTEQLIRIFRTSDVYVLPSLWDTSPVSIMEAMCLGLPVVATRVGGVPELVEDGVSGILVPPKEPRLLAEALSALIDSADLRDRMGRHGYRRSLQFRKRTWAHVAAEYNEAFLALHAEALS